MAKKEYICSNCGTVGKPKVTYQGSSLISILLLLLFVLPGLIYMIWRDTTRKEVCKECGGEDLIPINTPKGQEIYAKFQNNSQITE